MIEWFTAPFEYEFMQRALLSTALLSVGAGLLGPVLMLRRLALRGSSGWKARPTHVLRRRWFSGAIARSPDVPLDLICWAH